MNYHTFVREVGQYEDDGSGRHVDKFASKSTYMLCKLDDETVGMVAVHDQPPFSVAERLEDPRILHQLSPRPLEARLLAVRRDQRKGLVMPGLLYAVYRFALSRGYSHVIISGITNQVNLYKRIGFRALGPAVGSGRAAFVPMVLDLAELPASKLKVAAWFNQRSSSDAQQPPPALSLMPGPPEVAPDIRAAFERPLLYHRSDEFIALFAAVRSRLQRLAHGMEAVLLNGSGTLANDQVAACLQADQTLKEGLVLVNGEFSERVCAQAERTGLRFQVLSWDWGRAWNLEEIAATLAANPEINWIWTVHMESSTGVLNDIDSLTRLANAHGCRVYLDAVSSIGAVPIPKGMTLVSGVSGKCLGAYPGISFVLVAPGALDGVDSTRLPSYLDAVQALATPGPRFTFPSPVLRALHCALDAYRTRPAQEERYRHYARLGQHVRRELRELDIMPLAPEVAASPVITTFEPPGGYGPQEFVERCRSWGFELAAHSHYLQERDLVQIGTMGDIDEPALAPLFRRLRDLVARRTKRTVSRSGSRPLGAEQAGAG
ncbi:MAG: aminotransferase class V-fold PLP-dependent enzyme [Planctomycetota bacterium]